MCGVVDVLTVLLLSPTRQISMNICEPFRQTAGDIAKICDANFHHRLVLNIGEAIPWYLCMFLSFSCEWRSSVVQARMCKLGRDPLIFLKILVVIGHVCIHWSKVAEGFSVFNAVLFTWCIWYINWSCWQSYITLFVLMFLWYRQKFFISLYGTRVHWVNMGRGQPGGGGYTEITRYFPHRGLIGLLSSQR